MPEDRRHVQEIKNFYYGHQTELCSLPGDEEVLLKLTGKYNNCPPRVQYFYPKPILELRCFFLCKQKEFIYINFFIRKIFLLCFRYVQYVLVPSAIRL